MNTLEIGGVVVTSTWAKQIRRVGSANPADVSIDQYSEWSARCFAEIEDASVLLLLLPTTPTVGAWVELGFAHRNRTPIHTAGIHRPIFTPALSRFHTDNDHDAVAALVRMSQELTQFTVEHWAATRAVSLFRLD